MSAYEKECQKFIGEVVELKNRAGGLGLWRTMHAFDAVTGAYGYDLAGLAPRVTTTEAAPKEQR